MLDLDASLIARIRRGEPEAWSELIGRFEGRLLAFVEGRLGRRQSAEDVVQETFLGFLNSLPNFDNSRPLESYLFTIAAHKLTDHLRREGRRPTLPLTPATSSAPWEPPARARAVSSLVDSGARRRREESLLAEALGEQIGRLKDRAQWQKLACLELLLVRGWSNKLAAAELALTEAQVASTKFEFIERIKTLVAARQGSPADFPDLHDANG